MELIGSRAQTCYPLLDLYFTPAATGGVARFTIATDCAIFSMETNHNSLPFCPGGGVIQQQRSHKKRLAFPIVSRFLQLFSFSQTSTFVHVFIAALLILSLVMCYPCIYGGIEEKAVSGV